MNSFYSQDELTEIGFKSLGDNVLLSRKTSIYCASEISIGSNVRIDDFCILSGKILLGSYIHISAYSSLFGGNGGIIMDDFSCLSSRGCIYACSDDYSGESLTNPMVPNECRHVTSSPVHIKKHCIIGSGCTVLPGVTIEEGCSVGSMSLINKSTEPWGIYVGIPVRRLRERSQNLLKYEKELKKSIK